MKADEAAELILSRLEAHADMFENEKGKPRRPFSVQVRELREQLGLWQNEFAEKFGISYPELVNVEAGTAQPSMGMKMTIEMVKYSPERTAAIVQNARKKE